MEKILEPSLNFWSMTKEQAIAQLATDGNGLNDDDAVARLAQYGLNSIIVGPSSSLFLLFLSQFKSPITIMLIIAALLSAVLGDVPDTIIILVIILISSFLGFWQEKGAANAVAALLKMVQLHCDALRNGQKKSIPVEQAVPGDVIILSAVVPRRSATQGF